MSDWRYEVANGDTKLGYREWLLHRVESEAYEMGGGKGETEET